MADVKVLSKQEIFGCYIQAAWGTAAADAATFYTLQWVNAGVLNPDPGVTVDQFNVTEEKVDVFDKFWKVFDKLESKLGKTIPIEDLVLKCNNVGVLRGKCDDFVSKLKKQGQLFEPKRGFVQKV